MFENKNDWNKEMNSLPLDTQEINNNSFLEDRGVNYKKILIIIFLFVVATLGISFVFYKYETAKNHYKPANLSQVSTSTNVSKLPDVVDSNIISSSTELLNTETSSEKITFGSFYKKQIFKYIPVDVFYKLPINIKSDTVNYYDFSRAINLDQGVIDKLNNNGFAISKNFLVEKNGNFWSTYKKLVSLNVPIVITDDFLLYYFQNNLKSIYKEIEKSVFYNNLWDVNMAMYKTALARYKTLSGAENSENNPVLESARLELAFFATGLKLLEPKKSQISDAKLINEDKFSPQEALYYSFDLPDYLKNNVIEKEVSLILAGKEVQKSPIFLYNKDYKKFLVPDSYKNNAKLNNFFLASEWMRTEFPLFSKSKDCPDCLLDYDDWKINFGAAAFISSDLYKDSEIKNKWAIIYKYISFFSGLRQGLTFLNYDKAFVDLFGNNYNIEKIFSKNSPSLQADLAKVQYALFKFKFSDIEGVYSQEDEDKKNLGMRFLQDYFWPNSYIFNYLSGKELRKSTSSEENLVTSCFDKNSKTNYRCSSFGLDIVNLINPIDVNYPAFNRNAIEYSNYQNKFSDIYKQITHFNVNAWNNNVYWMILDIVKNVLVERKDIVYMNNNLWLAEKGFNTFLGGWVNSNLPGEEFVNNMSESSKNESSLGIDHACNKYNFVEPNIDFVNELISKGEMFADLTNSLGVSKNTNIVSTKISDLVSDLKQFRDIEKKEAEGKSLATDDCLFIKSFVERYSVKENKNNSFNVIQENAIIKEENTGVKLLFIVNQNSEGKKAITIGPIFNYQESRVK